MRLIAGVIGSSLAVVLVVGACSSGSDTGGVENAATPDAKPAVQLVQTDAVIPGPANNVRDAEVGEKSAILITSHDEQGSSPTDGIWALAKGDAPTEAKQITKVARPGSIAVAKDKTIYVSLPYASTIKTLDQKTGKLSDFAGSGKRGFSGDGGPAADASFNYPWGLTVHKDILYVSDTNNNRIRAIDLDSKNNEVNTLVGTGNPGFGGDGGAPADATLHAPGGLSVDKSGNLYLADVLNQRIRFVDFDQEADPVITTVAGNGKAAYSGDGGQATGASLNFAWGVAVPEKGDDLFTIADTRNNRLRAVSQEGVISTVAGTGAAGYSGDGGPAIDAELYYPWGITYENDPTNASEANGGDVLLFADSANHAVRELDDKLSDGVSSTAPQASVSQQQPEVAPPWPPAG